MKSLETGKNLIVCVKQVPDFNARRGENVKRLLESAPRRLNPYDGYALEAAARLRDADRNLRIIALSLGQAGEREALRQALAIAADEAFLAAVPNPDSLDGLAVSLLLARAVRRLEKRFGAAALILCGQQSTDGQSGQVGPQLAQLLNRPLAGRGLEAKLCGKVLRVRQETEDGTRWIEADLPCVATFTKPSWDPRFPTVRSSLAASRAVIPTLEMPELPSPALTRREMRLTSRKSGGIFIREKDGRASARKLFQLLSSAGV